MEIGVEFLWMERDPYKKKELSDDGSLLRTPCAQRAVITHKSRTGKSGGGVGWIYFDSGFEELLI